MFGRAGKRNANNYDYKFWQQNNQPMMLNNTFKMDQKLDHFHKNPVVAGYVAMPEHDVYSSEIDDAGGKGMIPSTFIQ
jgi:hypothetical protein